MAGSQAFEDDKIRIADPAQQFGARMLLSGATEFQRNHPLTEAVGAHLGWTSVQIDQFFIQAAQL